MTHAVEGWGKSSLFTHAPKPIYIQSRGETGLETLIASGQVRETPHFPEANTWEEIKAQLVFIRDEEHGFKTLVIDTANGAERLMYEYVCHRDFADEWGDRGFSGYMRGYEVSMAEWRIFLNDLDAIRLARKMTIVLLVHTKVKTFKNPEGPDYDRFTPDMHDKAWSLTHKWADAVLFGNFETVVKTSGQQDATKKGKAQGSTRMMYTERHASYDAKNRLGLAGEIEMDGGAAQAWSNLMGAIKAGKLNGKESGKEVTNAQ